MILLETLHFMTQLILSKGDRFYRDIKHTNSQSVVGIWIYNTSVFGPCLCDLDIVLNLLRHIVPKRGKDFGEVAS